MSNTVRIKGPHINFSIDRNSKEVTIKNDQKTLDELAVELAPAGSLILDCRDNIALIDALAKENDILMGKHKTKH